ncbi:MAG TPA: DUF1593 domain-containing protein [Verrucomicrobiota bacterium]|nr:DUF1593 domain-containing protein [Verrucomicrobiota bacterium]
MGPLIRAALICLLCQFALIAAWAQTTNRLRVIIETDAGGDPDDEQSLVRFLLYANEWDVEGIIANRPHARDGENRNPERTGIGIVRRLLSAYGECWTNLVQNDVGYPTRAQLENRAVAGDNETDAGVNLLLGAVDREDPRPLWYSDWGTDQGAATNNLRRALDRVLRERGPDGYARFKSRLRLASADKFGPHTLELTPPFPLWVDTFRPERAGRRWYHRFSELTSQAGGFDLVRDVLHQHGPLGALYPTNTTHWGKEGDSMTFLYLIPNGLNAPEHPTWGGWAGRYGPNETLPGRPYYWANQADFWNGTTNRDHTLARWAAALQNDFRARLDWCVKSKTLANHAPIIRLNQNPSLEVNPGDEIALSAAGSSDPDGGELSFRWEWYREPGTFRGALELGAVDSPELRFRAPTVDSRETIHLILSVSDRGTPPLTRYSRVVIRVNPITQTQSFEQFLRPPKELAGDFGIYLSPVRFNDGSEVSSPAGWKRRRGEIAHQWNRIMGEWPRLLERPTLELIRSEPRENFTQHRVRVEVAREQFLEGWLLVPASPGPLPAVLVPFYEPDTSVGLNDQRLRDFALQLTRRGFVTLAIGSPGGDARRPDLGDASCQPLSYLAYVAANCHTALAQRPEVDAGRIGIVGHSYGGKWALFAAVLYDKFAACAVSDPGIVWDETRPNVNYWEPWYLGRDAHRQRNPGVVTADNPRTGAYAELVARGRDLTELHALLAPRPFLVSGGSEDPVERWRALNHLVQVNAILGFTNRVAFTQRPAHSPTPESNEVIYEFFRRFL